MENKLQYIIQYIWIGVGIGSILGVLLHSYIIERDYKKYIKTPLVEVKYMNNVIYQDTCIVDSIKIYRR
jgi:hypothetical protein